MTGGGGDVVIVGGGPAGLVSAIACAGEGLAVTVLDRRRGPIDKACGEGLMPDAVAILGQLGVDLADHRAIRGIRYIDEHSSVTGRFPDRPGAGVRRPALHEALTTRARAVGVDLREGCRAAARRAPGAAGTAGAGWVVETDAGELTPRWLIGADGLHSGLRREAGLDRAERRHGDRRFGIRRHFRIEPWTDVVEVHWSAVGEAYITPVADDEVGVAVLWARPRDAGGERSVPGMGPGRSRRSAGAGGRGRSPTGLRSTAASPRAASPRAASPRAASSARPGRGERSPTSGIDRATGERPSGAVRDAASARRLTAPTSVGHDGTDGRFDRLLAAFPALTDRLEGAEPTSRVMAAGPLRQRTRGVTSGNLALVGDAAGYVDAITGEGMALAFHQATTLAPLMAAGDLVPYQAACRRQARVPNLLTELTLVLSRHPALRRRALGALAAEPGLFDRALAVHSRDAPPAGLVSGDLARAAVHLVTG